MVFTGMLRVASSLFRPTWQALTRSCKDLCYCIMMGANKAHLSMLHHTNIDRLWFYWQALRPDQAIFSDSYAGGSRFTVPSGTTISPRSPLQPFYSGGRTLHTTESVRSIQSFAYSYTGLEYWTKSKAQMARDTKQLINRLYAPNPGALQRRQQQAAKKRYFARIRFDRAHVSKPCQIHLYVRGQHASSIVVAAQPPTGPMAAGVPLDKITQSSEVTAMSSNAKAELIQSDLTVKVVKVSLDCVPKPLNRR